MGEPDPVDVRVRADIERHGWHVVLVPPEQESPGWAHTIGLLERFEHPELIVFGMDFQALGPLLNRLGEGVRAGDRFEEESERRGILEGLPVAFRRVERKWVAPFLGNAAWHYRREDFPVLQCFWPDPGGHFPWQAGCDPDWRDDQPLLYLRETQQALSEELIAALRREGAL